MPFMPPTNSMFLMAESREHPMHVGGLQLFTPPEGSGPEWVRDFVSTLRAEREVSPVFRRRPREPVSSLGATWWAQDDSIDLDYHVRHAALPKPGRVRELLAQVSHWHSTLLDRHRPLWEAYVVEGLSDGRIAVYGKFHHAMFDGVAALRLMQQALSEDPTARDGVPPWSLPTQRGSSSASIDPLGVLRGGLGLAKSLASLAPGALKVGRQLATDEDLRVPVAPKTVLNGPVGGARRFAAQTWELERIQRVAKSSGTTMNDVVLAMVAGALRDYLIDLGALPDEPLTAMVPVSLSLRSGSGAQALVEDGNQVGVMVVNLATNVANGPTRLEEIAYSTKSAKRMLSELSPAQILGYSAAQMLPLAMAPVPGFVRYTRPPFNVVISNVPGPRDPMYFNGARLDGLYPASIVLDGQAINVTLCSRADNLDFGIIGCRSSAPHLQRLLKHLETALAELEKAWG